MAHRQRDAPAGADASRRTLRGPGRVQRVCGCDRRCPEGALPNIGDRRLARHHGAA
jgi:hypothetical protein